MGRWGIGHEIVPVRDISSLLQLMDIFMMHLRSTNRTYFQKKRMLPSSTNMKTFDCESYPQQRWYCDNKTQILGEDTYLEYYPVE